MTEEQENELYEIHKHLCRCGSEEQKYELTDCHGIFLTYVCSKCEQKEREKYNPWVFDGYNQAFLDEYSGERIEPEETW